MAKKKSGFLDWRRDFCDWSISSHSIWKVMPSRHPVAILRGDLGGPWPSQIFFWPPQFFS